MAATALRLYPAAQRGLFVLALLTGWSCQSGDEGSVVSPPTPLHVVDTASVRIKLTRTMCFGTCPTYTVEITGNGEVIYDGGLHVAIGGREHATISRRDVAEILKRFEQLDYFSLPKLDDSSCHDATDFPSAITSLAFDQRSTSVDHYRACGKAPAALGALEEAIDSIAETMRWIERPPRATGSGSTPPPDEAMRQNRGAIVAVTSWWHLRDTLTGRPVYQTWVATLGVEGGHPLPAIVEDSIGGRAPLLSVEPSPGGVISGSQRGYGVILSGDGATVTAGDLVAGWRREYRGSRDGATAIITDRAGRVQHENGVPKTGYPQIAWRPHRGGPGIHGVRGVLDSIVVEMVDGARIRAEVLAFTSETAVALLKIHVPRTLATAQLLPDLLTPGDDAYAVTFASPEVGRIWLKGQMSLVGGSVLRRQGAGEENQLERYLWSVTDQQSTNEPLPLGTPFFDPRGRLAGLKVAALVRGEFPEDQRGGAVAALRSVAGWPTAGGR